MPDSPMYGTLGYNFSSGRKLLQKGALTLSYNNSAHPQAVTYDGTNTYAYDTNGNMITRKGRDLIYDSEDRLVEVKEAGVSKQSYTYNYTGERVLKRYGRTAPGYIT